VRSAKTLRRARHLHQGRFDLLANPLDHPRSAPEIFNPIGVRMPVASIVMRPFTGIVHALATPGAQRAIELGDQLRASEPIRHEVPEDRCRPVGAHDEYHLGTVRHSEGGFKVITVSSIDRAPDRSVSRRVRPCRVRGRLPGIADHPIGRLQQLCASPIEIPGIVEGM
jgi:hypothetical protein